MYRLLVPKETSVTACLYNNRHSFTSLSKYSIHPKVQHHSICLFDSSNTGTVESSHDDDDPAAAPWSSSSSRFVKACAAFEVAHNEDPRWVEIKNIDGPNTTITIPYSVHYHRRMAYWLDQLVMKEKQDEEGKDESNEALQLAVRCQHIRRWTRPRQDYPKGLVGYKQWRKDLAKFHAREAATIMSECGYEMNMITRVGQLLQKQNLDTDPDVQLLEDVICVVFLENEYTAFVEQDKYEEEKLVDIVQKTWKKMTPRGHEAALQLAGSLTERGLRVVERALEEG